MTKTMMTEELFQFTHPVWGATMFFVPKGWEIIVSIHAPRVGCDVSGCHVLQWHPVFQFTHPVWGATD